MLAAERVMTGSDIGLARVDENVAAKGAPRFEQG
jgi:hypothetical protein